MSDIASDLGVTRQMVSQVIGGSLTSARIREYLVTNIGVPKSYFRM